MILMRSFRSLILFGLLLSTGLIALACGKKDGRELEATLSNHSVGEGGDSGVGGMGGAE